MILSNILTDDRVVVIAGSLISGLFISLVSVGIWIFKKTMKQIEAGHVERGETIQMIQYKFRSINKYVRETDKIQLLHDEKIKNLALSHNELKEKVNSHASKLEQHGLSIEQLKKSA
jgi:hypothetical protein